MKPSLIDTDILSEFLRGNLKVAAKIDEHLRKYGAVNISIITYYEYSMGFCIRMQKNS
jgi:tRNA(fMet)-specific endonuclease VapC